MATIEKKMNENGSETYRVQIRLKNEEKIYKTFYTKEQAELFVFYKENLLKLKNNFDVPIEKRVTIKQIIEIKLQNSYDLSERSKSDFMDAFNRITTFIKDDFINKISYEDWLKVAKSLLDLDVYIGFKNEKNKKKLSISSVRRYFACMSSAISFCNSQGMNIENHPLKVMQSFITPRMKM